MRIALVTLLSVAALGVAACGGGDDDEGNGGGGEAATTQATDPAIEARVRTICDRLADRVDDFNNIERPQPGDVRAFARDLGTQVRAGIRALEELPDDPRLDAFGAALRDERAALTAVQRAASQGQERAVNAAADDLAAALNDVRESGRALGAERC
jgi:hypothetical protein